MNNSERKRRETPFVASYFNLIFCACTSISLRRQRSTHRRAGDKEQVLRLDEFLHRLNDFVVEFRRRLILSCYQRLDCECPSSGTNLYF